MQPSRAFNFNLWAYVHGSTHVYYIYACRLHMRVCVCMMVLVYMFGCLKHANMFTYAWVHLHHMEMCLRACHACVYECVCVCAPVTVRIDSASACVCVSFEECVCLRLRGLTGEAGLNLNAGQRAVFFKIQVRSLFAALCSGWKSLQHGMHTDKI